MLFTGHVLGPLIGGYLYQHGDFTATFAVPGVIMLILTTLSSFTLGNNDNRVSVVSDSPGVVESVK